MKKSQSTVRLKLYAPLLILALLLLWQAAALSGAVPSFLLPSPLEVLRAFWKDLPLLFSHLGVTLGEAALGLLSGLASGFICAWLMDRHEGMRRALYPLLVITQTVPTVAIAPLLVLWLGYGIAPKIVLILIVTFFPVATNLLEGFRSADPDELALLRAMGASERQLFRFCKWPSALPMFFSALKIAVSYAVVGAVIAEWLGGNRGLGVYMTRAKASYAFDKMFAVIFLISFLSLLLLALVDGLKYYLMPWIKEEKENEKIQN